MMQEIISKVEEIPVFYQYVAILIISFTPFLENYVAVPIGILLNLAFIPTILIAIFGNVLTILIMIKLTGYFKNRLSTDDENDTGFFRKRIKRAYVYFEKYGVPGIAFIGPLTTGNHIGAVVSIVLGAKKRSVIMWQMTGILTWAVGTGLIVMYGMDIYGFFVHH